MTQRPIFDHILLPIASTEDAEKTCDTALPYLAADGGRVTALNVIETAPGWPTTAPKDELQKLAEETLEIVREHADAAGVQIETRVIFAYDVTDAIIEEAEKISATAITFTPRSTRWWRSFIPGEIASKLVRKSRIPVVVLPSKAEDE